MSTRLNILAVAIGIADWFALGAGSVVAQTVHCAPLTYVAPSPCGCDDFHATIQLAVNDAVSGDTVCAGTGIFSEQVTITSKSITLMGAGMGVTTIKPILVSTNTSSLSTAQPIAAIILVDSASGVEVTDLTVDGSGAPPASCTGYVGIFYRASSGTIETTQVTKILEPTAPGCQVVLGIFVQSGNGGPDLNSSVAVLSNMVDNYGKNGITANGAGTFATVENNIVMGRGDVAGVPAQNGVQIGFGARGTVSSNTISNNNSTSDTVLSCGLLFFKAGGGLGRSRDNAFAGNEKNICNTAGGPSPHSPAFP